MFWWPMYLVLLFITDVSCHKTGTTGLRRLTKGLRSEKCVVRRFRPCANVIECTYTNLDIIAYYTPATNLYSMLLY